MTLYCRFSSGLDMRMILLFMLFCFRWLVDQLTVTKYFSPPTRNWMLMGYTDSLLVTEMLVKERLAQIFFEIVLDSLFCPLSSLFSLLSPLFFSSLLSVSFSFFCLFLPNVSKETHSPVLVGSCSIMLREAKFTLGKYYNILGGKHNFTSLIMPFIY